MIKLLNYIEAVGNVCINGSVCGMRKATSSCFHRHEWLLAGGPTSRVWCGLRFSFPAYNFNFCEYNHSVDAAFYNFISFKVLLRVTIGTIDGCEALTIACDCVHHANFVGYLKWLRGEIKWLAFKLAPVIKI
jgi:hypothetical protein